MMAINIYTALMGKTYIHIYAYAAAANDDDDLKLMKYCHKCIQLMNSSIYTRL